MRAVVLMLMLAAACGAQARVLPAFLGAEGFGAYTAGGRGGRVIAVTNLNDSGPGSLREACEAQGPRIVVFRVGGTIALKSHLRIEHPFITVAGQTAPGDGVLLRDAGLRIAAHDVVVRYLRIRIGESRAVSSGSQDGLSISGTREHGDAYNVIIDHCSFSWAIDENVDSYSRASDFTIQWCVISEGLFNSIHEKGPHSMGILLGPRSTRSSIHHCLFAHNNQRSPRIKGGRRDFVNNVVYNWGSHAAAFTDGPEVNFVGNCYKPGRNSDTWRLLVTGEDVGSIYLRDNAFADGTPWDWEQVEECSGAVRVGRRFHAPLVTTYPASEAFDRVLADAGCSYPARDAVDERVVRDARQGTGRIIDNPDQVGGFPHIAGGSAPADSDSDGMPDAWESERGLDLEDPGDACLDPDRDGYTNIEEYVNGLPRD